QAPVEDDLGGEPRIGTAEQHCERRLGRRDFLTARGILVRMLWGACHEPPVAGQQHLEGLLSSHPVTGHGGRLRRGVFRDDGAMIAIATPTPGTQRGTLVVRMPLTSARRGLPA